MTTNNWTKNSANDPDLMIRQLEIAPEGLFNRHGIFSNSTQTELPSMPTQIEGTQFPSIHTLTRNVREIVEGGVREPTRHKRFHKSYDRKKSSVYRGVTKCKGKRFESFVWDTIPKSEGKGGKTVYIGGFKTEIEAARAHDLIALKIWGTSTFTNFPVSCYLKEIIAMQSMSKRDCILALRRDSQNSTAMFRASQNSTAMSRNEEATTSNSPMKQTVDYGLSNIRDINEASYPNAQSLEQIQLDQHNYQLLNQHVTTPTFFVEPQNHDGFYATAGATLGMQENYSTGEAFPNQGSTIEQPMLLGNIGLEYSQAPQALLQNPQENIIENHFDNQFSYDQYQGPAFQNNLSFQNDINTYHYLSYDFGNTQGNARNAFNWESSIGHMGNENPKVVENSGVGSFGLDPMQFHLFESNIQDFEAPTLQATVLDQSSDEPLQYGFETNMGFQDENMVQSGNYDFDISQYDLDPMQFHSIEPNNQDFEAPTLQATVLDQSSDEPLQYGFETNMGFQDENMVQSGNDDFDISKYLNLNNPNKEETIQDLTDHVDELWDKMEVEQLVTSDLWFKEDGTPL